MTLEEIINENISKYRSLRVIVLIYWCIISPRQITTDSMLDSDGRHMVLHNTPTQNCRGPTEKNELGPPKGTT